MLTTGSSAVCWSKVYSHPPILHKATWPRWSQASLCSLSPFKTTASLHPHMHSRRSGTLWAPSENETKKATCSKSLSLGESGMCVCSVMSDSLQPHSLPGSSVHGIFQARILEGVAICSSRDLPDPGIKPTFLASPALAGGFFFTVPPRNQAASSHFRGPKRGVGGLGRGSEEHTDDEAPLHRELCLSGPYQWGLGRSLLYPIHLGCQVSSSAPEAREIWVVWDHSQGHQGSYFQAPSTSRYVTSDSYTSEHINSCKCAPN